MAWILFCPCDLLHGLKTVFLWWAENDDLDWYFSPLRHFPHLFSRLHLTKMSGQGFSSLLFLLIIAQKAVGRAYHHGIVVGARWSRDVYRGAKGGWNGMAKKKKIEGRSPYHLVPISLVVGELWSILKCVTCSCWSAHPHRSNCKNRLSREKSGFLYSSSRWQALSVLFIPSVQKWVCSVPATLEKTFYTTRTILSVLEHQLLES